MKAIVKAEKLIELIKVVMLAVPSKRTTLPIIMNVLVTLKDGLITVTGTNLDIALAVKDKCCKVIEPGEFLVKPKELLLAIAGVTGDVELSGQTKVRKWEETRTRWDSVKSAMVEYQEKRSSSTTTIKIIAGDTETIFTGENVKDFPPVPEITGSVAKFTGLAEVLKSVRYAMADNDSRPALNSAYLNPKGKAIEVCACDGVQLALSPLRGHVPEGVLFPAALVNLLVKLDVDKATATVELKDSEEAKKRQYPSIVLNIGNVSLTSRLCSSTYPDYAKVIPKRLGRVLHVADPAALANAVSNIDAFERQRGNTRRATLYGKGKSLTVTTLSYGGKPTRTINNVPGSGSGKVAIDCRNLLNVLGQVEEPFNLSLTGSDMEPVVIKQGKRVYAFQRIMNIFPAKAKPAPVTPEPVAETATPVEQTEAVAS